MLPGGAKRGGPRIGAIHVDHLGAPQKLLSGCGSRIAPSVVGDAIRHPVGAPVDTAWAGRARMRMAGTSRSTLAAAVRYGDSPATKTRAQLHVCVG